MPHPTPRLEGQDERELHPDLSLGQPGRRSRVIHPPDEEPPGVPVLAQSSAVFQQTAVQRPPDQRQGECPHQRPHQYVQPPPCPGGTKQRSKAGPPKDEQGVPGERRRNSPEGKEGPAQRREGRGQGAEQHDAVHVGVGVEQGETERRSRDPTGTANVPVGVLASMTWGRWAARKAFPPCQNRKAAPPQSASCASRGNPVSSAPTPAVPRVMNRVSARTPMLPATRG